MKKGDVEMKKMIITIAALFSTGLLSLPAQGIDVLDVGGVKYELNLKEIKCISDMDDFLHPARRVVYDEMIRTGCSLTARFDSSLDCSKITDTFLLRAYIVQETRKRNYCSCSTGPLDCTKHCSQSLPKEDCAAICSGNCSAYPRKW